MIQHLVSFSVKIYNLSVQKTIQNFNSNDQNLIDVNYVNLWPPLLGLITCHYQQLVKDLQVYTLKIKFLIKTTLIKRSFIEVVILECAHSYCYEKDLHYKYILK